ncbi:MAG: TldD/PmbA family protein [Acidimicrobiales bacterium]
MIDQELANRVLNVALAKGADFAEIFVEDRRGSSLSFEDRRVESVSDVISRGAGLRVVYGDTTGFAHTTDLSEPGLIAIAETARSVATGGSSISVALEPRRSISGHGANADDHSSSFKEQGVQVLARLDEVARSTNGSIIQVMAGISTAARSFLVANSDGVFASSTTQRTRASVSAIASGDTGLQSGSVPAAYTIDFNRFLAEIDLDDLATTASHRALSKLKARPAPSGNLPVILKRGSGGILFHEACGHGLEADHIVKRSSVYADRIGQMVASPLVTLIDDGTVVDEWGTYAIDDEGHLGQRNVLIENGVLVDYLWDRKSGVKSRRSSSGNGRRQSYEHLPMVRMTNTFLLAGDTNPEDIIASTPYGVYVAALTGGQVNTATGDFVFGTQEAYLIEDGHLTAPLRDTQLIGNGPETLAKIDAIGDDFAMTPGTCGKQGQSVPVGTGQATLRISEMTLGGTSRG